MNFSAIPMRFARPRHRTLPRALAARAWCALVAVAVLFGILQARTRYFYCEGLGLSVTDPCAHEVTEPRCPLATFDRAPFDCCEVVTMPSMPEGARAAEPSVPSAGVIATLPAVGSSVESSWSGDAHRIAWEGERWRGPPRASRERRAQLMVFLT
jgi:hypothetical protein